MNIHFLCHRVLRRVSLMSFSAICMARLCAQADNIHDSTRSGPLLNEIVVRTYEQRTTLLRTPASIGVIGQQTKLRFQPESIVSAVNTLAGVKMEQRSPGSYRINIRGSAARSPFGVRNVKVYYQNIPLTDPFGNTYLNQLSPEDFESITVIKGPSSSIYGSGTGGVVLINDRPEISKAQLRAGLSHGSFSTNSGFVQFTEGTTNFQSKIIAQHQYSDGYRVQTKLNRSTASWSATIKPDSMRVFRSLIFLGHLRYETPGALTLAEYAKDPMAARPAGGGFPGAENARAAIVQDMLFAGITYEHTLNSHFNFDITGYGNLFELKNPNIRAYERSSLPHFGARAVFNYNQRWNRSSLHLSVGAEGQRGIGRVNVYKNNSGKPDSLRTSDDIDAGVTGVFLQGTLTFGGGWVVTAGTGLNESSLSFTRFNPASLGKQEINSRNKIQPRVALLKSWRNISAYSSFSTGFSPPTTSELLPSGGNINLNLSAEQGYNYEIGARLALTTVLSVEANAYYLKLRNTIVQRRDAGGGDYFTNSGRVHDKGIEAQLNARLFPHDHSFSNSRLWMSYARQIYKYTDFRQVDVNYSGNNVPGISPHTLAAGLDLDLFSRLRIFVNDFYYDHTPLNDLNSLYARAYNLIGIKLQGNIKIKRINCELSGGIDNLLNDEYSLGNDINAAGGRYFNIAPRRNYYAALRLAVDAKQVKP